MNNDAHPHGTASDDDLLAHTRTVLLVRPDASTLDAELARAMALMSSTTNRTLAASLATVVAACLGRLGRTKEAHSIISKHLAEHDASTAAHRELLYIRSVVLMMENDVAQAITILEQLLATASSGSADDIIRSRALNVLGGLYGDQGRVEDAMRMLEENIVLREKLADPVGLAVAYYNYGEAWKRLDDHETAYDYLRRAYVIERAYGQNLQAVSSAGSLAVLAAKRGDESEALALASEGIDMALATGIDHQIVSAMLFKYEALSILGQKEASKVLLENALERTNGKNLDDLRFNALIDLAEFARQDGNVALARSILNEGRSLLHDKSNDYYDQRMELANARLFADEKNDNDLWNTALALMPRLAETQSVPAMMDLVELLTQSLGRNTTHPDRVDALASAVNTMRQADENRTARRLSAANIRFRAERRQHEVEVERLRNVELAGAMDRLRSAHESLKMMASDQNDTLHLVAHDLRSPLSAVRSVLQQGPHNISDQDVQQAVGLIDHMLFTLNALLSSDRRKAPSTELVNITYIARKAVERQRTLAIRRNHVIQFHFDEQIWCNTDLGMVSSILDNLIGNALKHTPQAGFITVTAQTLGNRIHITVSDTGPGIPPTLHNRLFTEYGTASASVSQESLGLGLYLSRRLAERLGGTIEYSAGPHGVGSSFTLVLPT
jgi:signal transduction histidine kinase